MLNALTIKNYALIDDIRISFSEGLNILIGETGAGKSIIISALSLALGGRAITEHVRQGKDKAIIEAEFLIENSIQILDYLDSLSIDLSDNIIITRREISLKGNSRCFINDSLVQVAQLKHLGEQIADFHGQHDNQILLKPENHVQYIDSLINNESLFVNFQKEYLNQKEIIQNYKSLHNQEKELNLQFEALNFELGEINKISPQPNEISTLEKELKILENSELLVEHLSNIRYNLSDSDHSTSGLLMKSIQDLRKLSSIDDAFSAYADELQSVSISVQEIARTAENYLEKIEFNPERIENIRFRLSALNGLKKKYGSYDEIFMRIEYLTNKLSLSLNFEQELELLKNEIISSKQKLGKIASSISDERRKKSKIFVSKLLEKLKEMSLENSRFVVAISNQESPNEELFESVICTIENIDYVCNSDGIDKLEFLISTNKGEEPKLLSNVASGGELSRIMLAIKSINAEKNSINMLIFDEIDSGISGKVAQRVGKVMKELASNHQIIAITHLAQIAALGDKLISIKKHEIGAKTSISAREEDEGTKLMEIAKLISGESITESSLKTVTELYNQQTKK